MKELDSKYKRAARNFRKAQELCEESKQEDYDDINDYIDLIHKAKAANEMMDRRKEELDEFKKKLTEKKRKR